MQEIAKECLAQTEQTKEAVALFRLLEMLQNKRLLAPKKQQPPPRTWQNWRNSCRALSPTSRIKLLNNFCQTQIEKSSAGHPPEDFVLLFSLSALLFCCWNQVAGYKVAIARIDKLGLLCFADVHHLGAPGMEPAALGWVDGTGHVALEQNPFLLDGRVGLRMAESRAWVYGCLGLW